MEVIQVVRSLLEWFHRVSIIRRHVLWHMEVWEMLRLLLFLL